MILKKPKFAKKKSFEPKIQNKNYMFELLVFVHEKMYSEVSKKGKILQKPSSIYNWRRKITMGKQIKSITKI